MIDQAEFSTDVLFRTRRGYPQGVASLYQHAVDCFGAEQVMTFLGRKYPRDQGEVRSTGVNASLGSGQALGQEQRDQDV